MMVDPKKYRKKPVVIEAVQWTGANIIAVSFFTKGEGEWDPVTQQLTIPTREGKMIASKGDYIIEGVRGEFYPCKPDIFAATYEEVVEDPQADAGVYR